MKRKIFKQKLEKIQLELYNTVPFLNNGGCIYFAKFFSNELKNLNIPHKIVVGAYSKYDLLDSLDNNGSFAHVLVYIKGIGYIDGHCTYQKREELESDYFSTKLLDSKYFDIDKHINNGTWNPTYSKESNSTVLKIITKNLYDD